MSMTRKDKIRQYKAVKRVRLLYYKHKKELTYDEKSIVIKALWKCVAIKEPYTKEERIQIKQLAKRYLRKKNKNGQ